MCKCLDIIYIFSALSLFCTCISFGTEPRTEQYVYVENTTKWVRVIRGDWALIGKLDKNGEFLQHIKLKSDQSSSVGVPPSKLINSSGDAKNTKKVYEYRSGALIPGDIHPDGTFVPEIGAKIVAFKDYQYSLKATPIWNLPGDFLTEEDAFRLKMKKPDDK